MKKHTLLVSCAAVLSATLLGACVPGASPRSSSTGSQDRSSEVTIWHYWDGANADAFDAAVSAYQEQHPDVKISAVTVPNSELLTKIQTAAQTDTLPTMVIGDLVWAPRIVATGKTADLSHLLPDQTVEALYDNLRTYGTDANGALRSVPVSANNLGFLYNKDLYAQAGVTSAPDTWEELISQGRTILEKTGKPPYELYTRAGDTGEGLTWNFQVNLWQAGGEFLNTDNTSAAFNTEAGRRALDFWIDLLDEGLVPSATTSWGEFEKGSAAAAQEGSWMVGIWQNDPPFPFESAQAPHPASGTAATNLGGEQALVFDGAQAPAAGDFLAWFLSEEQVLEWCQKTGFLPVREDVAVSADYTDWVADTQPLLRPYIDAMPTARTRPATPLYPKISYAFATEIEKALNGTTTAADALDAAESAVNKILMKGE
ncbi:extracellular solute-binding protein [Actinomyces sp. B33]|uniref:extracellular solute-binding protein n=1 Tax=Actinomyces sp. B33 TaxID=2942131 RepID=UPI002341585F|nr:extracellular solute-binding protein [Actinomyces sp. B33]MDC4233266.1 extracellular solute-binding protein [Actinomyces sp. B33]